MTQVFYPNKEFVLLYRNQEINTPQILLAHDKNDQEMPYAAQITFFPNFNIEDVDETYQRYQEDSQYEFQVDQNNLRGEYIFIVDRSGSMSGTRMSMTAQVLSQLLALLPKDSYYNVISFGSAYQAMYPESIYRSDENVKQSASAISQFESNMGGTEIFEPLQFALQSRNITHYPKNIILLTDGQVWNVNQCLAMIKQAVSDENIRVYAVGIGNGISK